MWLCGGIITIRVEGGTKMAKSFSQTISTGKGASGHSAQGAFSKSISIGSGPSNNKSPKTFSSAIKFGEEIEIVAGSKEWNKILEDIRKWRKTGGTLKVKLRGKPDKKATQRVVTLAGIMPKFTSSEWTRLLNQGFTKESLRKIEALRTKPPEQGHARYIDPAEWPEGGDAWSAITHLGFVDIDPKGFIHDDIPAY